VGVVGAAGAALGDGAGPVTTSPIPASAPGAAHAGRARLGSPNAALWSLGVSALGDALVNAALLMAATDGGLAVAALGVASGLPYLAAGRLGRHLSRTRLPAATTLRWSCLLSAAASVVIAASVLPSRPLSWLCYLALAVLTLLSTVIQAVFWDAVPSLVPEPEARRRFTARSATFIGLAAVIGPALGAGLVRSVGATGLCLANAASFMVTAQVLGAALRQVDPAPEVTGADSTPTARFYGLRTIVTTRAARSPVLAQLVANLVLYGVIYSLPLRARAQGWDSQWVGVLLGVLTAGTLLGSLLAGRLVAARHHTAALITEPGLRAVALCGVAVSTTPMAVAAWLLLFSAPQGFGRVARKSLMVNTFKPPGRVHVLATYGGLINISLPVAPLLMAAAVAWTGITTYALACAALLGACMLLLLWDRDAIAASV
jgi:MFS family permease